MKKLFKSAAVLLLAVSAQAFAENKMTDTHIILQSIYSNNPAQQSKYHSPMGITYHIKGINSKNSHMDDYCLRYNNKNNSSVTYNPIPTFDTYGTQVNLSDSFINYGLKGVVLIMRHNGLGAIRLRAKDGTLSSPITVKLSMQNNYNLIPKRIYLKATKRSSSPNFCL